MIREGDWSAFRAADVSLDGLSFAAEPLSLIGYSLGGIIATQLATIEPEIGVAVLAVTGGSIMQLVSQGPIYNRGYFPLLLPKLSISPGSIDYEAFPPRFMPEVAIWQTLLDRGDSIAYANTLRARQMSILMPMARNDENLHNVGTESLARAIGAEMVADEPLYADLSTTTAPVRDNVSVDGEMVTRAAYVWDPATHGLMLDRHGEAIQAHPVAPPFPPGERMDIDNPIDDALAQTVHFLQSFRTGTAEIVGPRAP
jgi:pimeloyl-ACP methyl ester carboxylesterase